MSIQMGLAQEDLALDFLESQGLTLIERNFRVKTGEIDLIMKDPNYQSKEYIVFIEVRYRTNPYYGSGLESVHAGKIKKLQKTAAWYLQKKRWTDKVFCRFDVVSLSNSTNIQWVRSAF